MRPRLGGFVFVTGGAAAAAACCDVDSIAAKILFEREPFPTATVLRVGVGQVGRGVRISVRFDIRVTCDTLRLLPVGTCVPWDFGIFGTGCDSLGTQTGFVTRRSSIGEFWSDACRGDVGVDTAAHGRHFAGVGSKYVLTSLFMQNSASRRPRIAVAVLVLIPPTFLFVHALVVFRKGFDLLLG